jgi:hypothetical protein
MWKLLLSALLLAGCATQPTHEQMVDRTRRASTLDLCYYAVAGDAAGKHYSGHELARRQSTCQAEMPLVMARIQHNRAAAAMQLEHMRAVNAANQANAQMQINAMRQPSNPAPVSPSFTCFTQMVGGMLQTICQ